MTANGPQILVINSGSSSLKFSVLEVQSESVLLSGIAERLGTTEALLKLSDPDAKKMEEPLPDADHRAALRRVTDHLRGWLSNEIEAVGHRIVHGANEELMIARQTAALVLRKPNRTLSEHDAGQTL